MKVFKSTKDDGKYEIHIMNLRRENPQTEFDFRVDRSTVLGNPFVGAENAREKVCNKYHSYLKKLLLTDYEKEVIHRDIAQIINALWKIRESLKKYKKVRLFCWCTPKRCHAEDIAQYLLLGKKYFDKEVL